MKRKRSLEHRHRLGMALRAERHLRGLSQEELAEAIDCHRNYVGTVERGEQNVTVDMLARFAKGLGSSLEAIFRRAGV
ncbi:MAG: helix-turn-helix transcriptional regulator [Verrucomicrobia bacterium]|nr:helix-turn-helix transcriptional regulator [Verrucomicrobiota bacterium]